MIDLWLGASAFVFLAFGFSLCCYYCKSEGLKADQDEKGNDINTIVVTECCGVTSSEDCIVVVVPNDRAVDLVPTLCGSNSFSSASYDIENQANNRAAEKMTSPNISKRTKQGIGLVQMPRNNIRTILSL